ncbi:MAG: hypothetical protein U5K37_11740 [Natrialbaceae archaeon]|nr:hypothetical protein [Natrialbaceae archaeon]
MDRFIAIELASRKNDNEDDGSEVESQDQDEIPEDVWELVVAHAAIVELESSDSSGRTIT